jgi:uncharacterized RDD family membrane protein YckC
MRWYYVEGGRQQGPLGELEFKQKIDAGSIQSETLVWHEGMFNWQPYRTVAPEQNREALDGNSQPPAAFCSHCGTPNASDDLLRYEGAFVCATCKPAFFQKVREGIPVSGNLLYAGFKIRLGAKLLDFLVLWVFNTTLSVLVEALAFRKPSTTIFIGTQFTLLIFQTALGAAYTCWFLAKYGATPGKMACRLKVVTPEGTTLAFGRALGRHFAEMLSGMILGVGYLMIAFDDERRALHDRICNTRVVRA